MPKLAATGSHRQELQRGGHTAGLAGNRAPGGIMAAIERPGQNAGSENTLASTYADFLGERRFSAAQRQAVATHVGRGGGNGQLQRTLATIGKVHRSTGSRSGAAVSQILGGQHRQVMLQHVQAPVYGPPTPQQAAQTVVELLTAAARILAIPNFIFPRVTHETALQTVSPTPEQRYMLFEFWLVAARNETRDQPGASAYRRATTAERLTRLEHANDTASTLFRLLGPEPWPAEAGEAVQQYRRAYTQARARVMDDAVESALESQPVPSTYEAPNFELEQQRLAVEHSLSALLQFSLLATRQVASTGARFSAEIRAALNQIAADAPAGTRLAGVGDLPIADAIVRVRGVLNGINSVLQLTDESRRTQLFAAQLNVRDVANVSRTVLGLAEGIVAMTSLIGSGVAQLRGNAPLAAQLLRLGTGTVVQRISWAANLAQVIHGFSVLLDNRATESDRVQGVFDVAMGSAGLTGAAATLGVETLRGLAGPLSAGIVVTAGEIVYLRNLIRGMEEGMATAGIVQSFDIVEYEAGVVAHSANELAQAIAYASTAAQDTQSGGAPGELAGAAQREVNLRRRRLRETMFRAIERVTQRQPDFAILFQPASWPRVSQPFQALYASLQQAHTSDDLLMVASTYLARARALFRHLTEAIVRTLQDTDRSRAGGVLPSVLGGLHDERRGQGGRTDTLWSEP